MIMIVISLSGRNGAKMKHNSSKTVFIINSLEGGGAEKVFAKLLELVNADLGRGYDLSVILLDKKTEVYSLPPNIKVYKVSKYKLLGAFKVFHIILKEKPNQVVSFLMRANFINIFYSKIFGYKSFISERSNTKNRLRGRFEKIKSKTLKMFYENSHGIICCSQGVADCLNSFFNIPRKKLVVINNPYNINNLENLAMESVAASEEYILAIGRIVKTKGFHDLICAYSKLKTNLFLKIVGDGPDREALEALCKQLDISEKVIFTGFLSNPYPIIKNSKFYVLSSYTEGFPNTLIESMSLSKPVIVTNCKDGPNEIMDYHFDILPGEFVEAKYGLMINTGDVSALANAMQKLITDNALNELLALKSRERASLYTEDSFYKKYKTVLSHRA